MTNDQTESIKTIDENEFWAEWKAAQERRDEIAIGVNAYNRDVLFTALIAAGIRTVIVDFDGYGDQGQIEDVRAYKGAEDEDPMVIPTTSLTIQVVEGWKQYQIKDQPEMLANAIETVCYEYLVQTHDGWETDEGAFGTFTFDAADKTIELDYNRRIEDSINFRHEF
jgi:uncharacterized protein DUF6878